MKRRSFLFALPVAAAFACGRSPGSIPSILGPGTAKDVGVTVTGSGGATLFDGRVSAKTPLEALQAAARATGLPEPVIRTVDGARYVASIGRDAEFWRYWVDGAFILKPANETVLAPGSAVVWRFGQ